MISLSRDKPGRRLAAGAIALVAIHLATTVTTGHARAEHLVVDGLMAGLVVGGRRLPHLLLAAMPLWLTGILYADLQPLLLPLRGTIHTGDLFALDAAIFPGPGGAPWPAFFDGWHAPLLDFVCGAAYLLYLFVFFGAIVHLYPRRRDAAIRMAWSFLVVNGIGIAIYLLYPAAPPWYVLEYGPGPADLAAAPSAAGAARFDALVGIDYFAGFYARNANVFGAMPSLHVAYPTLTACFLWPWGRVLRAGSLLFTALVAFSAVYLVHHYVLDVVAGIAVGVLTFWLVTRAAAPTSAAGKAA